MAHSTNRHFDCVETRVSVSKKVTTIRPGTSFYQEVRYQSHSVGSDPARSFSAPFGHQPVSYPPLRALTDTSSSLDHHRQLCPSQSEPETIEGKLLQLVKEILTKGFWDELSSTANKVVEIVTSENITKGLKCLLSAIFRLVGKEAPHELVGDIIPKLGDACTKLASQLTGVYRVCKDIVRVIECLFAIGIYALNVYKAFNKCKSTSSNFVKDFGTYMVARTTKLLKSCGGVMASALLSAIVGCLIGGQLAADWAESVVSKVISVVAFVIQKGIEWVTGKTYDDIVSAMEQDTGSSKSIVSRGHTPGLVHFYSIDTVCVEYEDDSLYYHHSSTTMH